MKGFANRRKKLSHAIHEIHKKSLINNSTDKNNSLTPSVLFTGGQDDSLAIPVEPYETAENRVVIETDCDTGKPDIDYHKEPSIITQSTFCEPENKRENATASSSEMDMLKRKVFEECKSEIMQEIERELRQKILAELAGNSTENNAKSKHGSDSEEGGAVGAECLQQEVGATPIANVAQSVDSGHDSASVIEDSEDARKRKEAEEIRAGKLKKMYDSVKGKQFEILLRHPCERAEELTAEYPQFDYLLDRPEDEKEMRAWSRKVIRLWYEHVDANMTLEKEFKKLGSKMVPSKDQSERWEKRKKENRLADWAERDRRLEEGRAKGEKVKKEMEQIGSKILKCLVTLQEECEKRHERLGLPEVNFGENFVDPFLDFNIRKGK
jgi:hypothetical protein